MRERERETDRSLKYEVRERDRESERGRERERETERERHRERERERVFGIQHSSVHLFGSAGYGRSEGKPINSASLLQDLSAVAFETGLTLIGVTMIVSRFLK